MSSNSKIFTVKCTFKYPKIDKDVKRYALSISGDTATSLTKKLLEVFPDYRISLATDKESGGHYLLNAKTGYDIKMYDMQKQPINEPIYHGAEGYAVVCIKEYEYKGKKGITAYLAAAVIENNGQPTGMSYDNIMKDII